MDSDNNAVEINVRSFTYEYDGDLQIKRRPNNGHALRSVQRRIENMTFDVNRPMANQDYETVRVNKWTFAEVKIQTKKEHSL